MRLTKEQAVIVSAYTGFLICDFADMHAYIERKMGRPVWTHEMASKGFHKQLQAACRGDYLALAPSKLAAAAKLEGE